MPDIDNLMEQVAQIVNTESEREVRFTSLDLLYEFGLTEFHNGTAQHFNFPFIEGRSTGTYAFNTGYYELTMMKLEFQKILLKIVHSLEIHLFS